MLRFGLTLILALGVSGSLLGQASVPVTGTVKDASGAAIPGVRVQLSVADAVVSTATTGNDGRYELTVAPGAPFTLIARLAGFGDEVVKVPGVEQATRRDIRLQVGRVA